MKKLIVSALAAVAITAGAQTLAPTAGVECRLGGVALSEDYLDAAGFFGDIGFVYWGPSATVGFWLGGGAESLSLEWNDGTHPLDTDITGGEFGLSLLLRGELLPGIALRGEVGGRYMFLDVDEPDDYYDWHGRYHYDPSFDPSSFALDIDDTALVVLSLQLEFNIYPLVLGVGGGYQFDCCKPAVSYCGEEFAEIDLSGAFGFVNFGFSF